MMYGYLIIEMIGNTPLDNVILLSAKTFALSAEFEVYKLQAAHEIKQAAKTIEIATLEKP